MQPEYKWKHISDGDVRSNRGWTPKNKNKTSSSSSSLLFLLLLHSHPPPLSVRVSASLLSQMFSGRKRLHVCHQSQDEWQRRRRPVTAAVSQVTEGDAVKTPHEGVETQGQCNENVGTRNGEDQDVSAGFIQTMVGFSSSRCFGSNKKKAAIMKFQGWILPLGKIILGLFESFFNARLAMIGYSWPRSGIGCPSEI